MRNVNHDHEVSARRIEGFWNTLTRSFFESDDLRGDPRYPEIVRATIIVHDDQAANPRTPTDSGMEEREREVDAEVEVLLALIVDAMNADHAVGDLADNASRITRRAYQERADETFAAVKRALRRALLRTPAPREVNEK